MILYTIGGYDLDLSVVDSFVDTASKVTAVFADFVNAMPPFFSVSLGLVVVAGFVRIIYELYR